MSDEDRVCLQSIKFAGDRSAGSRSQDKLAALRLQPRRMSEDANSDAFIPLPDHAIRSGPREVCCVRHPSVQPASQSFSPGHSHAVQPLLPPLPAPMHAPPRRHTQRSQGGCLFAGHAASFRACTSHPFGACAL